MVFLCFIPVFVVRHISHWHKYIEWQIGKPWQNLSFVEMSRNETKFFLLYIIWAICLVILTAGCDLQASQVDTGCSVCAAAPSRIKICSSNGTWIFRRCGHDQYCINEDLNCNAYCAPGCLSLDGSFFAKGRELCNHNSSAKIVCGDNGRWLSEPCAVQGRCGWLGGINNQ